MHRLVWSKNSLETYPKFYEPRCQYTDASKSRHFNQNFAQVTLWLRPGHLGIWSFALVVVTYSSLHCTDGPVRSFLQLVALEDPLVSCIVIARIWHLQKPWCPRQRKNGSKGYKDKKQKFSVESYYSMTGNVWHQREAPQKNVFYYIFHCIFLIFWVQINGCQKLSQKIGIPDPPPLI